MPSKEILKYFDATVDRKTRDDLKLAVNLVDDIKVAIDCGCGAGSDISFLRSQDFIVHAFDIEAESISLCRKRFEDDRDVLLSQASFKTYSYPSASLVVADASLFFCPKEDFGEVWRKITNSLIPNGVFSGSFLGPEDTMAGPDYNKESYWPDVLVLTEEQVKKLFSNYKIESFSEHRTSGKTPDGEPHQWHIFSVVAKKAI
ncbi:class I SAM-dependent methyltransferase [Thalassotalea ponticola]|uniref:class I SAM-dependent methyltransferase n=1 Tax=Thalassotalea ponticola TaxID=1523392 RepID=UPI0025B49314|nr:class I SAM-dependent methyltransferase [Thalassotalea ponticola]MDN3652523.1 class I SAM-dependent methyltransferase [Thalassotalea ponticola]